MSVKDGLSAIAKEVLSEVQKEAEESILTAQADAREALKTAKTKADKDYQKFIDQAMAKAEAEKRRVASLTEVETRNRLLQEKDALVEAAFEKALVKLREFTTTEDYRTLLFNLIRQASSKLNQESLLIQVNSRDKTWLTPKELVPLSDELNCKLIVSGEEGNFLGGLKAQTANGKVTFDSTLDTKFEELKPQLRLELARILFGEEM